MNWSLKKRLANAIAAFRAPIVRDRYAVIYDQRDAQIIGADSEEYYGYFADEAEARRMFGEAFGNEPYVHNAFLVRLVANIKPHREIWS